MIISYLCDRTAFWSNAETGLMIDLFDSIVFQDESLADWDSILGPGGRIWSGDGEVEFQNPR